MASPIQPVLDTFVRFRATWPRRGWSFDNRFQCVASTIDADFAPQARLLIAPLLPLAFSERSVQSATPLVRHVATRTGGLRAAQLIFAAEPAGYVMAYGLWWPWEEAQTISIRLGLEGATTDDLFDLCTVFGAEQ